VQKNVLRIGFDVSTENRTFFMLLFQKKEVAPFTVKNPISTSRMRKNRANTARSLYYQSPSCVIGGVNRYAIAILFHALMEAIAVVRNASSLLANSLPTSA
jgi:hypothetical protein